jgi:hypothetical protein
MDEEIELEEFTDLEEALEKLYDIADKQDKKVKNELC